jgi:hypothetical protein
MDKIKEAVHFGSASIVGFIALTVLFIRDCVDYILETEHH